jgi:surface antigen
LEWLRYKVKYRLRRFVPLLITLALLTGSAVAVSAAPAMAASTLCSGFSACETAPYTDHGWSANYTNSYWAQDSGHNCTNYVAYYEQAVNGMSASKPSWLGTGNADVWASDASAGGVTVSTTPVVGAVAWWGDYGWNGNDGHVGIVEKVLDANDIEVSADSYPSGPFTWVSLNSSNADTSTALGWPNRFIYAGGVGSGNSGGSPLNYQAFAGNADGVSSGVIGLRNIDNGFFFLKDGPSFNDQTSYQWAAGANYQPFVGDFNGDGVIDIGLRDVDTGMIYIKHGPSFNDQVDYQWAAGANYQIIAGDFDGDGIGDIGLRDSNNGTFYIKHGPSFNDQVDYPWAAGANYQPFVGDFNGDGIADIGLRDVDNGTFYIKHGPSFNDQVDYQWATGANYQVFAGDFNGDGIGDIGLRDIDNGIFFIKHGTGFNDQVDYQWAAG